MAIALIIYSITSFYINYKNRNTENEKRFCQLETMILKSQMNPHFIFNSLNSIRYLFMKDEKDKGLKYITKFAKLLRSTLNHGEEAMVNLIDEIELTELYISLEQLRFNDEFSFIKSYPSNKSWCNIKIPPFVIQPIVENAFWHGLSASKKKDKKLKITIENEIGYFLIIIEDNGIGFNNSNKTTDKFIDNKKSYGLKLINERFKLINKTQEFNYSLNINQSNQSISGTTVTIKIVTNKI